MKALSIIFFIYFFYSNNSFGQKVTYKDLIGTWEGIDHILVCADCHVPPFENLIFTDSILVSKQGVSTEVRYILDTSFSTTMLQMIELKGERSVSNSFTYSLIKMFGNDTLKIQYRSDINKSMKWNESASYDYTWTYIRIKEH